MQFAANGSGQKQAELLQPTHKEGSGGRSAPAAAVASTWVRMPTWKCLTVPCIAATVTADNPDLRCSR